MYKDVLCFFLDLVCEDEGKSCKKWAGEKKLCDENVKYKTQHYYVSMSRLCKKSCLMCGDDGMYSSLRRTGEYFHYTCSVVYLYALEYLDRGGGGDGVNVSEIIGYNRSRFH